MALAVVGDRHQQPTVAPSSPPCEASARLQPEAGPSTSVCNVSASLPHAGVGRRGGLAAAGGALLAGPLASLCLPGSAAAMRTVTLRDGTVVEAFEHGMSLSIVCLRGSVPAQWIVEYRQTLGKYAGFSLGQR